MRNRLYKLRRRHRLTKEAVDALPWPHPRPTRDYRLVGIHIALIWTAVGQIIFGPPPNSVQGRGFGFIGTVAFGALLVFCCALYLTAAYCKSQYESFGYEMAAAIGFALTLTLYAYFLITTTPNWALTYNWSFTVGLAAGNAIRGWILVRRLW